VLTRRIKVLEFVLFLFYIDFIKQQGGFSMEDTSFAIPATPRQIAYARSLALRNQTLLPWDVQQDRRSLSSWIDKQSKLTPVAALDPRPSSKQVAFAERLARIKHRAVPAECFRDKGLMSKWIDGNR
jgi:hypothetical protein